MIMWRSITDWTVALLLPFAILFMPVSQSISISRITVFTVPLLAYIMIDERISYSEILVIIGGFFGIIMIMNPILFNANLDMFKKQN